MYQDAWAIMGPKVSLASQMCTGATSWYRRVKRSVPFSSLCVTRLTIYHSFTFQKLQNPLHAEWEVHARRNSANIHIIYNTCTYRFVQNIEIWVRGSHGEVNFTSAHGCFRAYLE